MELKEGELALCQVVKIEGTTIFLDIEGVAQGILMLSEVAAGRIRNLREYVTVGKKIVCKILKVERNRIELSLRRVSAKERESVFDRFKKEAAFKNILKLAGEDTSKVLNKIKEKYSIEDFLDSARSDPSILADYFSKESAQKVSKLLVEKGDKDKEVSGRFMLKSMSENGVKEIKEILDVDSEIHYLGSGKFSISVSAQDFKEANHKLESMMKELADRAKKKKAVFEILKEA